MMCIFSLVSLNSVPLYADDGKLREFDASIVRSGLRYVILSRTAFYPEGGGQPHDSGILVTSDRTVKVLKVKKIGFEIFHYLDSDLPSGIQVHGIVDWGTRLWNTRRHSAEHLLTGLIESLGEPPKVFSSLDRLEYQSSKLTQDQVDAVAERFNKIVEENAPVRIYYEDRASIDAGGDSRKQAFLKKIPLAVNTLRMVDIGGYALTFCMGTHVESTGEIGCVELKLENAKKERKILHFSISP
jgi:Ser-tRNA(Ala) deacylase AlaX